jgi:hypothetical protein
MHQRSGELDVYAIDLSRVEESRARTLDLLRRTFRASPGGGGGWYNRLDEAEPGPTATAVALIMFELDDQRGQHFEEAISFLRRRQITSSDPAINGGWAINTSLGHPVTDATAWITRYLAISGSAWSPGAPDVGNAYSWMIRNCNEDGGWGASRDCPSRVWLTCLCLRALVLLNPHEPAICSGVDWLFTQQDAASGGWGETVSGRPSIAHTSAVLLAISEISPQRVDQRVLKAYEFLEKALKSRPVPDDGYVETYEVSVKTHSGITHFQNAMLHYQSPVALSALLRHPTSPPSDLIHRLSNEILSRQLDGGYWPSIHGGPSISIWSVWPFYQALTDVQNPPLVCRGDMITFLSGAVVVRRASFKKRSIRSLTRSGRAARIRARIIRHWATIVLALSLSQLARSALRGRR